MSKRRYPYKAWVLMPSFKPKEIELVDSYYGSDYDKTSSGKTYHIRNLHASKQAAIVAGDGLIGIQQADIDRRQAKMDKRKAELDKARAK